MFLGSGLAYAGDYTSSAHGNSSSGVDRTSTSQYTKGHCAHCHEQHASVGGDEPVPASPAGPDEYLLFQEYKDGSYNSFCTDKCHRAAGSWGGDNIASQYAKTYHHPTTGVHTPGEDDPSNRHGYCIDCHNPHVAQTTLHTVGNDASGPLLKVSGVSVSNSTAWTAPSYAFIPASTGITKEYQLCFKCHSTYPSSGGSDIAKEFNPANASFHPVELGLDGSGSGSSALLATQMNADWQDVGNQTMYCSDCHGSETSGDPVGPHGSDIPKILKGLWPKNSSGDFWKPVHAWFDSEYFIRDCLCRKCHVIFKSNVTSGMFGFQNNAHWGSARHGGTIPCVKCHVGRPHGSNWGRLIAEKGSDGDSIDEAWITAFTKKSPAAYSRTSCTAQCSGQHLWDPNN